MADAAQPRICVVGAANLDLISYVPRLPEPGETLHGTQFAMGYGGKGANQAAMAAKLGASVSMVTKLGRDVFGDGTLDNFRSLGIDTTHVHLTDEAFSGVAPIAVDPDGRNAIIIVTGANDLLSVEEVEAARSAIAAADVVVCQLEIALSTTEAALRVAREEGITTILNPAPALADLPAEVFALCDVLCPNEPETELLTGHSVDTRAEAEKSAEELRARGPSAVVLTLGERGCLVVDDAGCRHVERRQLDDQVGLAERPFFHFVRRFGQRIRSVAARCAGLDPMDQRADRVVRQTAIAMKATDVRVGMPRRHPLRSHDFSDHRCEAPDDVVIGHRERSDGAWAMAIHTARQQNRRDLLAVRNLRAAVRLVRDGTAHALAFGFVDGLAVQHRIDRIAQVMLACLSAPFVDEAVVDRAAIANAPARRLDHEGLAGIAQIQRFADELRLVDEDR
jgi:ribokinase